jgi:hypothetical protein
VAYSSTHISNSKRFEKIPLNIVLRGNFLFIKPTPFCVQISEKFLHVGKHGYRYYVHPYSSSFTQHKNPTQYFFTLGEPKYSWPHFFIST